MNLRTHFIMNAFPFVKRFAAFGLPLLLLACEQKEEQVQAGGLADIVQQVEVMPVQRMSLQETTQLVGTVAANESAELRPEYPGVVAAVHFEEGAKVSKGDALIELDTRELQAQLAETRAGLQLAARTLERNRKLLEDGAVSELEVDASEAEQLRLAAIIRRLEVQLEKSTLRAPFDGVAGARAVSVGDYVSSSQVVTTVDDLSKLKVEMEVPERYLPLLEPGSTFKLRAATSAAGEEVVGKVYFVSSRIDAESRSTMVKGFIEECPENIKPGMFANVTLVLREVKDALVVPESAVLSTPKGTVLIKPSGPPGEQVAAFVPVKLGLRVPGWVQITPVGPPVDGSARPPINAGDQIVSSGVGGLILFPGRKVRPVEPVVTPDQPAADVTDRKLKE